METAIDYFMRDYRVQTEDKLIWVLLRTLDGKDIHAQCRSRGIERVVFLDSRIASLGPKPHGAFWLYLGSYPEEWPICIGHELGHTFFYLPLGRGEWPKRKYYRTKEEEGFCENFAQVWLNEASNLRESRAFAERLFKQNGGAL